MATQGTIKTIDQNGYGFIRRADGGRDIFFHCHDVVGMEFDDQLVERRVEFDIGTGPDGRERAVRVRAAH